VPGESEGGCLFDEISNLVEPTERSAMDGVVLPERPGHRSIPDRCLGQRKGSRPDTLIERVEGKAQKIYTMAESRDEDTEMQRSRIAGLHMQRIARWAIAGTLSLVAITGESATPPIVITSPVEGTTVMAGKPVAISVNITSGSYPAGIAIIGQDPLGDADIQPVSGSMMHFSLMIPANTPPNSYAITAVGMSTRGELVTSAPVNIQVEGADKPTFLVIYPASIAFAVAGDTTEPTVVAQFTGGSSLEVTHSSRLVIRSEDPTVAVIRDGVITAVGPGHTSIAFQYGPVTIMTAVTVDSGGAVPKK
jgi:hypothetical protein